MEDLVIVNRKFWRGRSVFVTGHTGFKGSWLTLWLQYLGAEVHGYALDPPNIPNMFDAAEVAGALESDVRADLASLYRLEDAMAAARPVVVFHLAAQSLVRESYADPIGTFATNVMGTANVLQSVRSTESVRSVVVVTTDKVYENREWVYPYRESDALGGRDPYSASKAAAELVTSSFRSSFLNSNSDHPVQVATACSGNVIGGRDWGIDRIVPDCLRAFEAGEVVLLRHPTAVRPWQHVLEPLAGYLMLAERLNSQDGAAFARAWNFGPDLTGDASVRFVADELAQLWGQGARVGLDESNGHPHEAGLLRLDSGQSRDALGWEPRWPLAAALEHTVDWYRAWQRGETMSDVTIGQIRDYVSSGVA